MAEEALQAWKKKLFQDFLTRTTFTTKDYEIEEQNKSPEERERLNQKRFEGYQKLCLAGLGTMFWGTAASVLSHVGGELLSEVKMSTWVHGVLDHLVRYSSTYATIPLILMLLGLFASTFPSSSPRAAFMAGLGAWQSFVFILGTFHAASRSYYTDTKNCFYCFLGSSASATLYWGFCSQDPVILHIIVKLIVWVIKLPFFCLCFVLYHLSCWIMFWSWMGWECLGVCFSSFLNAPSALYHRVSGYQLPPGQGQGQP